MSSSIPRFAKNSITNLPKLALPKLAQIKPFAGFEYDVESNKSVEGGAQKKACFSGVYRDTASNQKFYIKKSNPADDTAEVLTSRLARFLGANAAECKFVVSKTGELYVASKCSEGFKPLVPSVERGIKNGWLGSNPISQKNKKAIHKKFKNSVQIEDVAKNLVSFMLLNQNDAHVGNFGTHKQLVNFFGKIIEQIRVVSIDFGWGLEGISKDSARKINLDETLSPLGVRGTHDFGGIPTNHFKDFEYIVNSHYFIKALDEVIKKAETGNELENELKASLKYIVKSNRGEARIKNQLNLLAKHMGLEIPDNIRDVKGIQEFISNKLNYRLKERLISMSLTKVMLQIKLRKDSHGRQMTAKKCLEALRDVIRKYLPGRRIDQFMPVFKPDSVETLLSRVIEDARCEAIMSKKETASISSLVRFAEEIKEGRNPVKGTRFVRQSQLIEASSAPKDFDEIRKKSLAAITAKYSRYSPKKPLAELPVNGLNGFIKPAQENFGKPRNEPIKPAQENFVKPMLLNQYKNGRDKENKGLASQRSTVVKLPKLAV